MCDTKYFQQALDEFRETRSARYANGQPLELGQVNVAQLSELLRRAQELKDEDKTREREAQRTALRPEQSPLGRMGID